MPKQQKLTLILLLFNIFIPFMGIGLITPIMPTLMNELGISGTVVGYLTAVFALSQLICSPISGKATDKIGRKKILVLGLFLFGFSELLFGLGQKIETLFLARIFGGISSAMIMPAVTAFIADITSLAERPKAMGYMAAIINTGFIIGPGIGGFLAEYGTRAPFFVAAGFGAGAGLLSLVFLKEPERPIADNEKIPPLKMSIKRILVPMYLIAFSLILIASFGISTFESFFSLYVDHKFGFSPKEIALVITIGSVLGALLQAVVFKHLVELWQEIKLIRYSLMLAGVLIYLVTIVHSYGWILLVTTISFVGFDLFRPAVTSFLSKHAGDEQGFLGGMNSMFTSIGNIFGPVLGGVLFDINIDYPYYFAMVVVVIGAIITLFWNEPSDFLYNERSV